MQIVFEYGRRRAHLEVAETALVPSQSAAPLSRLENPAATLRAVLNQPLDYPPLSRALTPDDQIAILVDERLPRLTELLIPLLECIVSAGIAPSAITLLCLPPSTGQSWLEELPEELEDVRCEVHDPNDRRRLSFVTTSRGGKPLYLNRTAVDAAQLIVLSGMHFDPLLGVGGGTGALYPALADRAGRDALCEQLTVDVPGTEPWRTAVEASEAAWLLGVPFFVQALEGAGDDIAALLGGTAAALSEATRVHDALWRRRVPRPAQTVVAALGGNPARHSFADLADAVTCAARVVQPDGTIIILSEAALPAAPAIELLRAAREPEDALREFSRRQEFDLRAAWQWARAAQHARICLLSNLEAATVKELFAIRVENLEQVQRVVTASKTCLFLSDAHKTLAVLPSL